MKFISKLSAAFILQAIMLHGGSEEKTASERIRDLETLRSSLLVKGLGSKHQEIVSLDRLIERLGNEKNESKTDPKNINDNVDMFGVSYKAAGIYLMEGLEKELEPKKVSIGNVFSILDSKLTEGDLLSVHPSKNGVLLVVRKEDLSRIYSLIWKAFPRYAIYVGPPSELHKLYCENQIANPGANQPNASSGSGASGAENQQREGSEK